MTTTTSRKNKNASAKDQDFRKEPAVHPKKQLRLAFGLFFLIAGIYICFVILSYFFTWKQDQDLLMKAETAGAFVSNEKALVANWGGRLGALLSHALVFRGAGIASLALGIWVGTLGLNMVYGKKVFPLMKYLRWISIFMLVGAPVLAFLIPNASFPWGGAWGDEAILYLNGLIGSAGTGLLLAGTVIFFATVIFALDITPVLRRAKHAAKNMASQVAATTAFNTEEKEFNEPEKKELMPITLPEEALVKQEDTPHLKKEAPAPVTSGPEKPGNRIVSETMPVPETASELALLAPGAEIELTLPEKNPAPASDNKVEELNFEVFRQQEEASVVSSNGPVSFGVNEPYAPELDLPDYHFPTLDLLEERNETITLDKEELQKNKDQIVQTLRSFGIEIQRISATVGPTVTLYEIVPAEGVRISKIRNLEDDIALNLAALGIRIIAPIPGKGTIGIEVPNANKQIVSMRALLSSEKFANSKMSLPIALGKKIDNENYIVDLATMPHLLVAGATGQGKSVGINAIIVSLLYKKHPSQLKFVLVDPKKVELSIYNTIEKHFLAKLPNEEEAIITDNKKVINTLNALCIEMDNRYELLKEAGARNIKEYNEKFINRRLNPNNGHKYLPFIVLVVDEFADLIMTAGKEVEMPIARLAQLARAVGIHLIVATQRPSVNVITGTIKANFPARIGFKVSAKVDSRTILDAGGAEQLIGRGDMLVSHGSELLRLQCAFVDTPEVEKIVNYIGEQRGYPTAFELPEYESDEEDSSSKHIDLTSRDKLFEDCARVVVQTQSGSTSMLQRRFNLGYNRAGRIMDQMEAAGIVGPAMGSKPREVLYYSEAELEQFLSNLI